MKTHNRSLRIGIFGSAVKKVDPYTLKSAKMLGQLLAKADCEVITGACIGASYETLLEAKKYGAKIIGFSPDPNKQAHEDRHDNASLSDFDKVIFIKGITRRSLKLVEYCDALIVLEGRMGTLSEYTIAFEEKKPIGVLSNNKGISEHLYKITKLCNKHREEPVYFYNDIEVLFRVLLGYLKKEQWKTLASEYQYSISITDEELGYKKILDLSKKGLKGSVILDYGCGFGKFSRRLENFNPKKIIAVDISKEAIRVAKEFMTEKIEYKLIKENINLIEDNSLDIVFLNFVLCTIEDKKEIDKIFQNIKSKLKDKGKIIILEPHPNSLGYKYISMCRENPKKLVSGMPLKVNLLGMKENFYDYWRSKKDYKNFLKKSGFKISKIIEPKIKENKEGFWLDEIKQAPTLIIVARK